MGIYIGGDNYYQDSDRRWRRYADDGPIVTDSSLITALNYLNILIDQRRFDAAKSVMSAMASRGLDFGSNTIRTDPWPWVAQQSVKAADTLIAELMKAESDTRCSVQTTNRG